MLKIVTPKLPSLRWAYFTGVAVPLLGSLVFIAFSPELRWINFALHTTIESLGGFIAIAVSGIFFQQSRNISDEEIWISCGLFGMAIGFVDYITKPLNIPQFLEKINKVLK